jgi:hypothetical protein
LQLKGQEIFQAAVGTADTGEALMEVAAVEKFVNDLGHDGPERAIAGEMVTGIFLAKRGGVFVNALPEGRAAGLAGLIELERLHGGEYRKADMPSSVTGGRKK